jgi:hypothetical protein
MENRRLCARPGCGVAIERKEGETAQNFSKREYCGRSCAALHSAQRKKKRKNG